MTAAGDRMRLAGFVRTGRALAPLLAGLVVLGMLYGGGQAQAGEAYGVSAVVLFPVLAWQTKLLLDIEPDVQRRLAVSRSAAGRRELPPGLLAAGAGRPGQRAVALVLPWPLGRRRQWAAHPGDRPWRRGSRSASGRTCWPSRRRSRWARWPAGRSTGSAGYGVAVLAVGCGGGDRARPEAARRRPGWRRR